MHIDIPRPRARVIGRSICIRCDEYNKKVTNISKISTQSQSILGTTPLRRSRAA
jgi:hypothetical protein